MAAIAHVEGKVTFTDGKVVEFMLAADGSSRWGETKEILGRAVDPTEAMQSALRAGGHYEEDATDD